MAKIQTTGKRLQISKANSVMVIAVGVAAFMVTFCAIASKTLLSQRSYQARVIEKKEQARDTLNQNVENVEKLAVSYKAFVETEQNVLGGDPKGTGDKDGDNAKIVLDALPSKYDFPALATSLEKLIGDSYTLESVQGVDDEVAQAAKESSSNPVPIEIPVDVSIKAGSYGSTQGLFSLFERSIRPFKVNKLTLTSGGGTVNVDWTGVTYYQPSKSVEIQKEVVQ